MFTGIIEAIGTIEKVASERTNRHFFVRSDLAHDLHVDQSLSHNGVCLTVTRLENGGHWVTSVKETLDKSNLGDLKEGDRVNLERSMPSNGRFDGHIVQGHVDTTAIVTAIDDQKGSWTFTFEHNAGNGNITVEKGSICVNGISLTCFNCTNRSFSVAIIPFTYTHTNLRNVKVGNRVNLEFDILGKYVQRLFAIGSLVPRT